MDSGPQAAAAAGLTYAGFWARFGAVLIDMLWLVPLAVVLVLVGVVAQGGEALSPGAETLVQIISGLAVVLFWASKRATPGKMALGLRLVDARTGDAPGLGRLLLRYVGYTLSALPLGLGYFWMLWDERRQTWHDKLGRTLVVRDPGARPSTVRLG